MKKILSIVLAVCMLLSCAAVASAASKTTEQKADALYVLGLFKGTNKGYELDKNLTREQGIVMLLRLIGKEAEATSGEHDCPFDDVYEWAEGYIGYAFEQGITLGVSETKFGYGQPLTDAQFLTMLLRALGYTDGDGEDFVWDDPYALANEIGLIPEAEADSDFTRGDMVEVCYNLLSATYKESEKTVADQLKEDKVITDEMLDLSKNVADGKMDLEQAMEELSGGNGSDDNNNGGNSGGNGGNGGGGGNTTPAPDAPDPTPGPNADETSVTGEYETENLDLLPWDAASVLEQG